jgi:hypothetical protein
MAIVTKLSKKRMEARAAENAQITKSKAFKAGKSQSDIVVTSGKQTR